MNKKQLITQLSGSLNLSKADAERTFDTITNTILEALKGDDTVKIAGFGTYKVAKRKARVGKGLESKFKSELLRRLSFYQLSRLKKCLINN
jgi:nucleoid DNA-binding protein